MSEDQDPKRYAYLVEGQMSCGTLSEWARECEHAILGHLNVSVRLWDGEIVHEVAVERESVDSEGRIQYEARCGNDIVRFTVDG